MDQFVEMLMQIGVVKCHQYRMHWSASKCTIAIADVMPLQQFENLKLFFHLNENTKMQVL